LNHSYDNADRLIKIAQGSSTVSFAYDAGNRRTSLTLPKHKTFTVVTNVKVYFCDLQRPCQRGSNENNNGLLRQYFPKRTELSGYTQAEIDKVALRLSQRPRRLWV
jgi:YD repeat-containing protein